MQTRKSKLQIDSFTFLSGENTSPDHEQCAIKRLNLSTSVKNFTLNEYFGWNGTCTYDQLFMKQ